MKQFLSLVIAGAVGAGLTIGVVQLGDSVISPKKTTSENQFIHPAGVNNTLMKPGAPEKAVDFTFAAEVAMKAVVLVEAKESEQLAQRRREEQYRQNPLNRFFEFDFGNDFFNRPFGFGFPPRQGSGSGVLISQDGYVVTNNHVIDFADKISVSTNDGKEYDAQVIGRDPSSDLAVLKIEGKNFPTLEFGDSDQARVGEWVLAVGNPFEYLTSTVTAGIISAKGRDINLIRGDKTIEEFIQTDAAINPGNSGGALVDSEGKLIGINTAIASQTGNYAGYSFAIPINLASTIINDIIENGGVIERTNLGVVVEELDSEYAKQLGLGVSEGLVIREVVDGSAAQFAGVLPNDVILAVNDKEITRFEDLKKIVDYAKVGDTLELLLYREGKEITLPVRLRKRI
jgi:Do/DeqQ family serine protease